MSASIAYGADSQRTIPRASGVGNGRLQNRWTGERGPGHPHKGNSKAATAEPAKSGNPPGQAELYTTEAERKLLIDLLA